MRPYRCRPPVIPLIKLRPASDQVEIFTEMIREKYSRIKRLNYPPVFKPDPDRTVCKLPTKDLQVTAMGTGNKAKSKIKRSPLFHDIISKASTQVPDTSAILHGS